MMVVGTKTIGFKAALSAVIMFVLLNLMIYYLDRKDENNFSFAKLCLRNVPALHYFKKIGDNFTVEHSEARNKSVIPETSSNLSLELSISRSNEVSKEVTDDLIFSKDSQYFNKSQINRIDSVLQLCKDYSPDKGGPIKPNTTLESLDLVEQKFGPAVKFGGWFQPANCIAKYKVAIIVPFRDRYAHLSIFLKNIHPFLMKQNIQYRIFIIEQTNGKLFNRAALMNIGYKEALKLYQWDCFIFHDVDLLPLDERNVYNCPNQPRHMSVAIDIFGFNSIFGGVSAMSRDDFLKVNGFSNSFWGWGGEDDDMSNRLKHANLYISRYPVNIARYMMLNHQKERANPKRYENLVNGVNKFDMDGLNSLKYDIYSMKEFPLFTWLLADLKMSDQR